MLIYELLDEVMDNGYPQILSADSLKLYITQTGVKAELDRAEVARRTEESRNATMQARRHDAAGGGAAPARSRGAAVIIRA